MIGSRKFTTLGGSCGESLPSMICRSSGPWLMRIRALAVAVALARVPGRPLLVDEEALAFVHRSYQPGTATAQIIDGKTRRRNRRAW